MGGLTDDVLNGPGREFSVAEGTTYLDHAALSPIPRCVREAVGAFHEYRARYGADFPAWWQKIDEVRHLIAAKIGAGDDEIVFTANASMGINLAAAAIPFNTGDNVVITDAEFPSNVYPWMNLRHRGVEVRFVRGTASGFTPEDFDACIDGRTRAVSVSWVTAGTGERLDIARIGRLCRRRGVYFVVDAMQGMGVFPLDLRRVPADFVVSGFFKWMFGPDGIAFAYINRAIRDALRSPYAGWAGMRDRFRYTEYAFRPADGARRFETGNMNFSAAYGVASALDMAAGMETAITERIVALTAYLRKGLAAMPHVRLLSVGDTEKLSGITLFTTPHDDALFARLAEEGVVVSHRNGIRVSPHFYNTAHQIDALLSIVESVR
ncbi:MAG: aminotransferase class V-fold PLP-dependent enzyme [Spirochaetales bacterium]|nr:aminotransferase class V-fold PLP-dependent enzyme [Spirochaetales bacterium]